MRLAKITLLVPRRAVCSAVIVSQDEAFFSNIYTFPNHRRRGLASDLILTIARQIGFLPEFDIQHVSKVMERIAQRFGYTRNGASERYSYCDLWLPPTDEHRRLELNYDWEVLNDVIHGNNSTRTLTRYLRPLGRVEQADTTNRLPAVVQ